MKEKDVQEWWKDLKSWKPQSIQYATIDLNANSGSSYKGLTEELVEPFYSGPINRAIPALFVLKGTFAYLITGPDPVDALHAQIKALYERKDAKPASG